MSHHCWRVLNSWKILRGQFWSTAAKVFDPVGFLSPFVVRIKRLMQEIWERGLDWDSKVTGRIRVQVEKVVCGD
ncbi:hypothetical protein CEXT_809051 [Caerostris extrusa]|uniref:Uncharacterized protein n=1 Tax=Caerostris extrusa TaxID=172846 RepID=A0AAV4VQD4_CAEEX|nr:hypothetical protein CEXT_809051 [Caerostris extrusa]